MKPKNAAVYVLVAAVICVGLWWLMRPVLTAPAKIADALKAANLTVSSLAAVEAPKLAPVTSLPASSMAANAASNSSTDSSPPKFEQVFPPPPNGALDYIKDLGLIEFSVGVPVNIILENGSPCVLTVYTSQNANGVNDYPEGMFRVRIDYSDPNTAEMTTQMMMMIPGKPSVVGMGSYGFKLVGKIKAN